MVTSSERPVRTAAEIARAMVITLDDAEALLRYLEYAGVAEPCGSGYRATAMAWEEFPRPPGWESKT